jgi:hypothetical protein
LGKVTADISRAGQSIACGKCKKRWKNIYALAQMEEDEWDMRRRDNPKTGK